MGTLCYELHSIRPCGQKPRVIASKESNAVENRHEPVAWTYSDNSTVAGNCSAWSEVAGVVTEAPYNCGIPNDHVDGAPYTAQSLRKLGVNIF